jgi:hypothetical protein
MTLINVITLLSSTSVLSSVLFKSINIEKLKFRENQTKLVDLGHVCLRARNAVSQILSYNA